MHLVSAMMRGLPVQGKRACCVSGEAWCMCAQVREFRPKAVAIRDASKAAELKEAIQGVQPQPEILVGEEGAIEVARHPDADAVVTGIVGEPVLAPRSTPSGRGSMPACCGSPARATMPA